ncbi:hypothetical protein [Streptomyces sp. MA15]|uniref:hypothetical protein n=1 Tax=Streptomyces sp. MA15 TaxID=3055061 RepID=UPI0025AFA656|nr:hypothetical protein [Streptomyces sp. MA15]MDN3271004.1 hypothetical protein [Streptomyces sp. MA15]
MRETVNTFRSAALLVAATALVAGGSVAATAAPGPDGTRVTSVREGEDGTRVTALRKAAERVVGTDAKPREVTADAVRYDGLTVTAAPRGEASTKALSCGYGHLCMVVNGTKFDFYTCRTWKLSNWTGDGPFTNNQTPGTVARFYNKDGSVRWTSTAYESGTATWDPIWYLRPC